MNNGHMPRLARLVSQNRKFNQLMKRLHIDEARFIYSAGLDHYGLPAFRSAWGRLGEFRIKLGKGITVQALSLGHNPNISKKAIFKCLLFDELKTYALSNSQVIDQISHMQRTRLLTSYRTFETCTSSFPHHIRPDFACPMY